MLSGGRVSLSAQHSTLNTSSRRGHTLPEVLVVLTILSLFAFLALPRFANSLMQNRLDATVSQIRDDLRFARTRAIATGIRHQVILDPQTRELVVLPYRPEEDSGTGAGAGGGGAAQVEPEPVLRNQVPEEVRVVEWNVSPLGYENAPNARASLQQEATPLVFYPEDRSDSAILVLESEDGRRAGLAVDPTTGEIRDLTEEELARTY